MQKSFYENEIAILYKMCGITATIDVIPKNTINTGNINNYLSYPHISTTSADRLRWE